jgi:hypothetical protein
MGEMYHCHFIFHSDFGMMAMIRILPEHSKRRQAARLHTSGL